MSEANDPASRLGVLDASEIPPTYSAPPEQFVGLIAGGDAAIRHAQEGAEDSVEAAEADLGPLSLHPERDALIGIAASGQTPYVLGCLAYAKRMGCVTVGVACSNPSKMEQSGLVDYMIVPVTGPEVVTGSTRMKAGTATKLVLNTLSTAVMIRVGKTFGNMVCVPLSACQVTNMNADG
jgi:N-acetylmuramic acid 6-phosphate etherase